MTDKTTIGEGETIVLRRLADAMDALQYVAVETYDGSHVAVLGVRDDA